MPGGPAGASLNPPGVLRSDVVVRDGRVAAVGTAPEGIATHDCSGCLVVPGNVCAHHHLYSSLARGMPYRLEPPDTFVQILQRVWWRLDRALTGPDVYWSAWAGGAGALLAGTTTLRDHHASPHALHDPPQRLPAAP